VLPAAALIIILMVGPIGETIYRSFTNWDGLTSNFIGLTNYRLIFSNPVTSQVLLNSVIFLISVPLILIASVLVAVLVYERVIGWRVFRFLFFIPAVLSPVIVGALFSTFFLPSGLVDKVLSPVGLSSYPWLSHPWTARAVVILALVWTSFGFGMVVVLSALSTIDPSLYDAAAIDGASWWGRLRSITLPLISGSIQFLSVINVIYTFTSLFSFVYVITAGGPGFATTTVDYFTYLTTFENGQFGYGAALAVLLFVIVLLLTIVQLRLFPKREVQGS
jgi:ABC-type sugar transport system permease subunit